MLVRLPIRKWLGVKHVNTIFMSLLSYKSVIGMDGYPSSAVGILPCVYPVRGNSRIPENCLYGGIS